MEVSELIELAQGSDTSAREAAEQLGAMGVAVLPTVLEAVSNPWIDPGMLPLALTAIYATAPVDALLQGLDRSEHIAFQSAITAAVKRPEEAVYEAVVDKLRDGDELPGRRAAAAELLGNRGDIRAIQPLIEVYPDAVRQNTAEDDPPRFAVETVVALAKLGDFGHGSYLVDLVSNPYGPTRALAARGLQIAVGPGMVDALRRAAQDAAMEVGIPALEALFLLRCPAAVNALVDVARDASRTVSDNAVVRANDILGTEFSGAEELASWWSAASEDWDADICYRAGRPFTTRQLFDILGSAEERKGEVLREIELTTGSRPGGEDGFTPDEASGIAGRLNREGQLYRWGHPVELAHVR